MATVRIDLSLTRRGSSRFDFMGALGYRLSLSRWGPIQGPRTAPISSQISAELQQRIKEAKELLTVAEQELEVALSELESSERADKKMISHRLELAFAKVSASRRNLEAVLQEVS
ncbi:hypothetical protein [Hyalangium versicolor]|uniref:hypothetical protein n=1 Tax=Hyalangium versicolor TaxID=2861190 RepID=UPI001CCFD8ED|nr:hypothetical protein [Hyalangium versicolor]